MRLSLGLGVSWSLGCSNSSEALDLRFGFRAWEKARKYMTKI